MQRPQPHAGRGRRRVHGQPRLTEGLSLYCLGGQTIITPDIARSPAGVMQAIEPLPLERLVVRMQVALAIPLHRAAFP